MSEQISFRIEKLPVDVRGYPVPWFVHWEDGVPDFRVIGSGRIMEAVRYRKCWVCGEKLGKFVTFVIGPMCVINRISSEPPSHRDCAQFAAKACPFLTRPRMKRNEHELPDGYEEAAGMMIRRNPGVAVVWTTLGYGVLQVEGGVLFRVGEPLELEWYAQGRAASRQEILHSIETGLPFLEEAVAQDGPEACAELGRQYKRALELAPQ